MDKENAGVLFATAEKSKETSPDHTGNVVLSADLVKSLAAAVKAGKPAKLSLSAWNNTGRTSGKAYLGLRVSEYKEKAKDSDDLFSK
jgi:hypothetical protein